MSDPRGGPHRAALLQLPVPESRPDAARSNVPLASGYLAAHAASASPSPVLLPPRLLQDHGGDAAILSWLVQARPRLVGFTTYLWNIGRSLWLARALKARLPETAVVLGGPEIASGHPLLAPGAAPEVDAFVIGEGEEAWATMVAGLEGGLRPAGVATPAAPLDPRRLSNPYLAGALEARAGESLFLETVRGCTRRCDYCYYAKAAPGLRPFGLEQIAEVFRYARGRGVADLTIMDPCFNASPDFRQKLRLLAAANTTRIPLHTELELEAVSPEVADLLRDAGFSSVEAGLQSTNRAALRAVHRGWRRAEFIRGGELLRERGISVRTGIILGLPRDTMEGFLETIAFVREHGFAEGVELYPLSVLPGTTVRSRAAELGLDYMSRPPYWVLSNTAMREPDMLEAIELAEAALDMDFFHPVLPCFHSPAPGLVAFRDLRAPDACERFLAELRSDPAMLAVRLTLLLSGPAPADPGSLELLGRRITEASPHTLVQLVVDCDETPPYPPWERASRAFFVPEHYFNQIHYYKVDRQQRFSVRLTHLTGDPDVALRSFVDTQAPPFDLLLRFSPALLRDGSILDRLPPLLVEGELAPEENRQLAERYHGLEGLILRWER